MRILLETFKLYFQYWGSIKKTNGISPHLNRLAQNEHIENLLNFEIHFHKSGMNLKILKWQLSAQLFGLKIITWSFLFLNAIQISKVPGHYINLKKQYSIAHTAVNPLLEKGYLYIVYFEFLEWNFERFLIKII